MRRKLIGLVSILLLASCKNNNANNDKKKYYFTVPGEFIQDEYVFPMNTISKITFYDNNILQQNKNTIINDITTMSHYFDRYHDYDGIENLKSLNDSGYINNCNNDLYDLIKTSVELCKITDGKFNVCIGRLIDAYSSYLSTNTNMPTSSEISTILNGIVSYNDIDNIIVFDDSTRSITINKYNEVQPIISIGGIGKGYIGEKIYNHIKSLNTSSIINLGESTIGLVGNNPYVDNGKYNIGFNLPNSDEYICISEIDKDYKISTSADNIFSYDKSNPWISHILNPNTGYSNPTYRSVSLISSNATSTLLDALSTAIFNCNDDNEAKTLLNKIENTYNVKIDYLLLKPYYSNDELDLNKYNCVYSKGFKDTMNGDFNSNIINKEEL